MKNHNKIRLLLADDNREATTSLSLALQKNLINADIHLSHSPKSALTTASKNSIDVAILDLCIVENQGVESGFKLLQDLLKLRPHTQVLILTGHGDTLNGVRALECGARNFLIKPANIDHLTVLVKEAFRYKQLQEKVSLLQNQRDLEEKELLDSTLIGCSSQIKKLREDILFAASNSQPVILLGETGVGKGHAARLIHQLSKRSKNPFVRFQPGLTKDDLLASELFGHIAGAFTGALEKRDGILLKADNGSFFLDEIDGLPPQTQIALLGVLQDKTFRAVGADNLISVNTRFISATNASIAELIASNAIRKDFYHRIAQFEITIPPLRERREDIPLLSNFILHKMEEREEITHAEISQEALSKLQEHTWPGNIRALQASVENACFFAKHRGRDLILSEDIKITNLGDGIKSSDTPIAPHKTTNLHENVRAFKKHLIHQALNENSNNQVQAAKSLGIDRSTLRRILDS